MAPSPSDRDNNFQLPLGTVYSPVSSCTAIHASVLDGWSLAAVRSRFGISLMVRQRSAWSFVSLTCAIHSPLHVHTKGSLISPAALSFIPSYKSMTTTRDFFPYFAFAPVSATSCQLCILRSVTYYRCLWPTGFVAGPHARLLFLAISASFCFSLFMSPISF